VYSDQELPVTLFSSDMKKSMFEYMAGDFDPINLLEIEIRKSFLAKNITSSTAHGPTVSAKIPSSPMHPLHSVSPGTESTLPAYAAESHKKYPMSVPEHTRDVTTPEHKLAAHRVLANHHLHNYHYAMSQEGPKAAEPFAAKHFAHRTAAKDLENQGVKDTPQHHTDLYNHYYAKMKNATSNPDPFRLEMPYHSAVQAHVDHLNKVGYREATGEPEKPPESSKPSKSPRRLYEGGKFVGLPSDHPSIAGPRARAMAASGQLQARLKEAQMPSASFGGQVGEEEKTRKGLENIRSLYKSACLLEKDYGYGGEKEAQELAKPQAKRLPSLFPEMRQERKLNKQRSDIKQKQVEQQYGSTDKSLKSICDLFCLVS
jgi:hypothetical protein